MSVAALTWVLDSAPCPSSQAFATLVVFANFANADGRAYPSTETVAAKSRQNPKTVRAAIDALELVGALVDTGRRVGKTGAVKVYALGMEGLPKVGALAGEIAPDTCTDPEDAAGAPPTKARPKTGAFPQRSKAPVFGSEGTRIRVAEPVREPLTPEDADASSPPKVAKRPAPADPGNWSVPSIEELPSEIGAIARQWPAGAYRTQAEGHRAWLASQRRRRDPDRSWQARIIQLGALPCRDGKAGLRSNGGRSGVVPDLVGKDRGSQAAEFERQAAMFDRMGRPEDAESYRRMAAVARGG